MLIEDIKELVDDNIRQRTLPGSITRTNHAQIEDDILNELRDRGLVQAASTDELDEHSHTNTHLVIVWDIGVFAAIETGASADNDITFDSFDSGWLWRKILDLSDRSQFTLATDGTYSLPEGYLADLILIKPSTTQTQKAGLTLGGDEILLEQSLTGGIKIAVQMVIIADGAPVTLYFSGISASTEFTIFKRRL